MSRHETGHKRISFATLEKYAQIFGIYYYEIYYAADRDTPTGSNRLKERRQQAGLTRNELSKIVNIGVGRIELQEAGETGMTHEEIAAYARALKVYSSELFEKPISRSESSREAWLKDGKVPFDKEEQRIKKARGSHLDGRRHSRGSLVRVPNLAENTQLRPGVL